VTATARWKGADVVQQSVTTAFQPGAAVLIVMHLERACIPKTCDADQTCEAGSCGPKARTPTPYPGANDAGNPRVDAGQSTDAADAGANDPRDAAMDGKPPASDGSFEAGDDTSMDAQDAGSLDVRDSGSPDVPTMICGDGVISGTEICDDFNASACGTCNESCTSQQMPAASVGSITAVAASMLINGETLTLSDGVHNSVVFEFNSNVPTDTTHIQIVAGSSQANGVATKIALAVNGVGPALQLQAVVNASNNRQVLLTNVNPGANGNVGVTETVANSGFLVAGMSGGIALDCAAGVGCGSNNDCRSGVCCLGAGGTPACPCSTLGGGCNFVVNTCLAPSCNDGVRNGNETGIDCGGTCPTCPTGQPCIGNPDCTSATCCLGVIGTSSCPCPSGTCTVNTCSPSGA
jgi:hypothetical protein